jgi:hypothetical protein
MGFFIHSVAPDTNRPFPFDGYNVRLKYWGTKQVLAIIVSLCISMPEAL